MNRAELAIETEHTELLEALDRAKAKALKAKGKDVESTLATLVQAKTALSEFRVGLRTNREGVPASGTAKPATVKPTTKGG